MNKNNNSFSTFITLFTRFFGEVAKKILYPTLLQFKAHFQGFVSTP